ncbi:MAG: hypothetical protein R3E32_16825 [Chitinophagales bacterium]
MNNKYLLVHIFNLFLSILLLWTNCLQAQDRPLGTWRAYLSYESGQTMILAGDKVYVGTRTSLYSLDPTENSIHTFSPVDGLSDLNIKSLGYYEPTKTLIIAYDNANVDLMPIEGKIVNVSDIKRANILNGKTINHVLVEGDFAYLSCGFGIVYLDILKAEIKDTYIIGQQGSQVEVYQVAVGDGVIMAATEDGIYKASLTSGSLTNFNNWVLENHEALIPNTSATAVAYRNGRFYAVQEGTLFRYEEGEWMPQYFDEQYKPRALRVNQGKLILTAQADGNFGRIAVFEDNEEVRVIGNYGGKIRNIYESALDEDGSIWTIDFWFGLHHIMPDSPDNNVQSVFPEGPFSSDVFGLEVLNDDLFVMPGGASPTWGPRYLKLGFYHRSNMGEWTRFSESSSPSLNPNVLIDFIYAKKHPSLPKIYLASFGGGLVEYDYENFTVYDDSNSSIQYMIPDISSARYRISGIDFDSQQNMWISNFGAPKPISVQTSAGEWYAFGPSDEDNIDLGPEREVIRMNIDGYDQKWVAMKARGILVFNHGPDLANSEDDFYLHLLQNNGRIISNTVFAVARDLEGWMWVGTDKGAVYYTCDPVSIQEGNCQAVQPILEVDGFGALLLGTENVRAIAVDGANRKWFGTDNGVFLMSSDGTEQIQRFTTENSPLLSNSITSIAINDKNGEVFFGTNLGVVSYKGDAIGAESTHTEVVAYPNPVRPEYAGPIAIKGLAQNAVVKITDIGGNLMYETRALGGQAVWDGRDYTGRKAATGVYLIFSSSEDGTDTNVAKLLIVN